MTEEEYRSISPLHTRKTLLYGVRRLADAARRQQQSGLWLSREEVEALLDEPREDEEATLP